MLRWLSHVPGFALGILMLLTPLANNGIHAHSSPSSTASNTSAFSAPHSVTDPNDLSQFFEEQINRRLDTLHSPGATVSVVHGGQVVFAQGYGYADVAKHQSVSPTSTLFRVGSISKVFTVTAVMQLVEQGKLDLHRDVNSYLKTFQIPATYPQPITVADLLTHTAGFEERNIGSVTFNDAEAPTLERWLANHIPSRLFPPGQVTAYSNYGNALAGYLVEVVSGEPYATYMQNHVLDPLDMTHSTFQQPVPSSLASDRAVGYTYEGGTYRAQPFEHINPAPAGALSATAVDMAHFAIAYLRDGVYGSHQILQPESVAAMHQQQYANAPGLPGMAYGFYEVDADGQRLISHNGGTLSFLSVLYLLPQYDTGFFISTNSLDGDALIAPTLLTAFMDRYFPGKPLLRAPLSEVREADARSVSGDYWTTRRAETTMEKIVQTLNTTTVRAEGAGRIVVNLGGTDVHAIEVGPLTFQSMTNGALFVFKRDGTGQIARFAYGGAPASQWTRIAWYASPTFTGLVLMICLALFASGLFVWAVRLFRRRNVVARAVHGSGWALLTSWLTCAVFLGSTVGVVLAFINLEPTEPSLVLYVLMTLYLAGALAAIGVVALTFIAWSRRWWSLLMRLHFTAVAVAMIAFTWFLNFWNLLGYQF